MENLTKYLMELDNINGVSGDEERVAAYLVDKIASLVDEYYIDDLGNVVFIKKGTDSTQKLMLSAHMDEIGFIVRYIEEDGFLRISPVGIHDPRMAINQVLTISVDNGMVHGVTGSKPGHIVSQEEAGKTIAIEDIFVDVGTFSRKETMELGVRVGDYVTFHRQGQFLNNSRVYTGKSIDNRSGCAVMIQVLEELKDMEVTPTIYAVATVQEEIGIRGAGPVAYSIQPNVALAIDVAFAGGTPSTPDKDLPLRMGKGPVIKFFDWSLKTFNGNAVPKRLTKQLMKVAEEANIPYQRDVNVNGATDGAKISLAGKGVLTGGVSIPMRYMHTAVGCILIEDMQNTVNLLKSYIKNYGQ